MRTKEHKHHRASRHGKSRHDVLHSARKYIRRHWKVVPVRPNEKVPRRKEWQNERIKESEISKYFPEGDNIGILWGEPSHWLVDVDLDCDEAVALAPSFLPKTDRVYGRESRLDAVEATWKKFIKGEKVTGIPRLKELIGEKTGSSICQWLGIGRENGKVPGGQSSEADVFHSYEDFESAPPVSFSIDGILQDDCVTVIAALSGHGKTLTMLSMAKALLKRRGDKKLWNQFPVREIASRVLYLIPESGITPFKARLKHFHMYHYVKDGRLLVHTLSKGPTPDLSNPKVLAAAKDAYVFLDPIIRFEKGNENEAAVNQQGLAKDIFALIRAGAKAVVAAHHAPKNFSKESVMTLENMLRGTGDIGAMVATAWGIKQLDAGKNIIHIENLKARDFEPSGPFQIIGRPYINEEGDFRIHKKPGECGSLVVEEKNHNKGGASPGVRRLKAENKRLLAGFLRDDPNATSAKLVKLFKKTGITISKGAIRKYRMEFRREVKKGA